ncbi:DUF4043 family protein [Paracoccus sp. CPCC 101403]|uniref:DUF4043 family protein n=1 Tax=Paracoccus broussonetiae TaxID=3075834 RepID=A0ABU3EAD1_9RHOB|nr:DUF4043 family protein [Paracoccus sp. CPCC 101403]MDT1061189.1 DUF4043 family protein [Paracoccus sp. CPCC 101403]
MADTALATALQVQKWLKNYYAEYVRSSGFLGSMGTGTNSIIQVKRDLTDAGKSVNIPLITRLKGAGVVGKNQLAGNEEALGNFNQNIAVDFLRHAVVIDKVDEQWTEIDLLGAAKDALTTWAADKLRDAIIAALGSIDGVVYGTANATQKNAWTTNNVDRVLFGNAVGNYNATHATALNNVLGTMKMTASVVSLMKRIAKTADPHIRPTRVNNQMNREYFQMFCGSMTFRDLKNDTVMQNANREARPRDVEANPIFQDGDLIYDGVIIREIPEIAGFNNTAGTVVRIEPVYLCGAQAVGLVWGQEPKTIKDDFDYGRRKGIGTEEVRGVDKLRFGTGSAGALKDHGVVTGFMAAPLDA